jgi:hypothetical protein
VTNIKDKLYKADHVCSKVENSMLNKSFKILPAVRMKPENSVIPLSAEECIVLFNTSDGCVMSKSCE